MGAGDLELLDLLYVATADDEPRLKVGNVFAIEPMINVGSEKTRELDDGWSVVTADGSLSAHFEHTILIEKEEPPSVVAAHSATRPATALRNSAARRCRSRTGVSLCVPCCLRCTGLQAAGGLSG